MPRVNIHKLNMALASHIDKTLDAIRLLGAEIPDRLNTMGIFRDVAFTSFLRNYYWIIVTHRIKDITVINQVVSLSLLFTLTESLGAGGIERVSTCLQDDDVATFLFEFTDGLITVERARLIAG